jgi:hypothetical protein
MKNIKPSVKSITIYRDVAYDKKITSGTVERSWRGKNDYHWQEETSTYTYKASVNGVLKEFCAVDMWGFNPYKHLYEILGLEFDLKEVTEKRFSITYFKKNGKLLISAGDSEYERAWKNPIKTIVTVTENKYHFEKPNAKNLAALGFSENINSIPAKWDFNAFEKLSKFNSTSDKKISVDYTDFARFIKAIFF